MTGMTRVSDTTLLVELMISDWYALVNKAKKVTKSFKTYVISFAVKHVVDGQKLEYLTISFNSSELPHLHFIC